MIYVPDAKLSSQLRDDFLLVNLRSSLPRSASAVFLPSALSVLGELPDKGRHTEVLLLVLLLALAGLSLQVDDVRRREEPVELLAGLRLSDGTLHVLQLQLAQRLLATGQPFCIAADWNMTPAEFEATGFDRLLNAQVIQPVAGGITCRGRRHTH